MVAGFAELLATLESADFFIGVLPFVITYAIFFLTLDNSPKFRENQKMTMLVSLSIAFLVSYYVVSQGIMQMFFVNYFGTLTVGLLGIMGLFVAFALTGMHDVVAGKYIWTIPVIVLVAAAWTGSGGLAAFFPQGMGGPFGGLIEGFLDLLDYLFDSGLIWAVLILGVVAWASGDEDDESSRDSLMRWLMSDSDNPYGSNSGSN